MIWLWPALALAERPTEGGLFAFDPADVVVSHEEGGVRVHWASEGPSVVPSADGDEDGLPDFVESVLTVAADALAVYEGLGLRAPLRESEVGLGPLGGSDALDVYLVDFGGSADGHFGFDACQGDRCAGYLVVENDFRGYGYPSVASALRVVVPHELFHGVQGAYDAGLPVWMSEGTAVWAERQIDPSSWDFLAFADAYLAEPTRPIDRPPGGPVPSFAYGTALFFDFVTTRHDPAWMHELLLETEAGDDASEDLEAALAARDDTFLDLWPTFAAYNLATGSRSGSAESYDYALRLDSVPAEAEGAALDGEYRLYPLATTYFRLDHAGGPLDLALDEGGDGLVFTLHAVVDGRADGPVLDAAVTLSEPEAGAHALGDLPAGGYWLAASHAVRADDSVRPRLCLGPDAADCAPVVEEPQACGCGSTAPGWGWLALLPVLSRRRAARAPGTA